MGKHANIPFSRVNHGKFMVTEKAAYIGEPRASSCVGRGSGLGSLEALESLRDVKGVGTRPHERAEGGHARRPRPGQGAEGDAAPISDVDPSGQRGC